MRDENPCAFPNARLVRAYEERCRTCIHSSLTRNQPLIGKHTGILSAHWSRALAAHWPRIGPRISRARAPTQICPLASLICFPFRGTRSSTTTFNVLHALRPEMRPDTLDKRVENQHAQQLVPTRPSVTFYYVQRGKRHLFNLTT